jgi:hypothetical protein
LKQSFLTTWRKCDTDCTVVSDRLGAIEYKELTKSGQKDGFAACDNDRTVTLTA